MEQVAQTSAKATEATVAPKAPEVQVENKTTAGVADPTTTLSASETKEPDTRQDAEKTVRENNVKLAEEYDAGVTLPKGTKLVEGKLVVEVGSYVPLRNTPLWGSSHRPASQADQDAYAVATKKFETEVKAKFIALIDAEVIKILEDNKVEAKPASKSFIWKVLGLPFAILRMGANAVKAVLNFFIARPVKFVLSFCFNMESKPTVEATAADASEEIADTTEAEETASA